MFAHETRSQLIRVKWRFEETIKVLSYVLLYERI